MRKTNILIFVIAIIVFLFTFLFDFTEKMPEKPKKEPAHTITQPNGFKVPDVGLHTFINKPMEEVQVQFGKPERIDPTAYGYEWWVYGRHSEQYVQFGIEKGKVVSIYALGKNLPTKPFEITKDANNILRQVNLSDTTSLTYKGARVEFEFKEDELMTNPLIKFGDVWVQLYFDHFTNRLMAVRYLTTEVLIKQKPYSFVYTGNIVKPPVLNDEQWTNVQKAEEVEIFDLTNILRMRHGIDPLRWNDGATSAAFGHSKEMFEKNYFSHESKWSGNLADRLKAEKVDFTAAGENIAADYPDGLAAVAGWLNSEGHRHNLLNPEYTDLGVGVFHKYFTQDFVKPF
ncbi:MAG: CAP domain-containing protein [Tuberibacillus sp.]